MGSESTRAALERRAAALSAAAAAVRGDAGGIRVSIGDDSAAGGLGFDRIFAGLGALLENLPAALAAAVPAIRQAHALNFATEGASGRGAWAGLAPSTVAQRARLGFGPAHPILVRTGGLRADVLGADATPTSTGSGAELRIRPDGGIKYLANALGTSRIPGRPMVTIGPSSATAITSLLSRELRALAGAR